MGDRLAQALAAAGALHLGLRTTETIETGLARASDGVAVVVVESRAPDQRLLNGLGVLREAHPELPIIVLAEPLDEAFALQAIRAGAMHCLATGDALQPRVVPLIVDAVRPSGGVADAVIQPSLSDEEFGTLHALCGPTPSPVSARSFGMRSLVEKSPDEFRELARDYTKLLRRAIEAAGYRHGDDLEPDLHRMVERLGMLSAGPRDMIEIHKIAISAIVAGAPPLRAKAMVEEARLFLLRIMGYLVGFYRMLSWGRPADRLARSLQRAGVDGTQARPPKGAT
jgi:hypothetical protein